MDAALAALYDCGGGPDAGGERGAGLQASAPRVARWLGDIRGYFPSTVVQVVQKDAIERLSLDRLLLQPEMLEAVEPDVFGTQLGGGTDINRAVAYCQGLVTRPADTIFVLVSDLYEGGIRQEVLRRVAAMTAAGVQVIALLALSDEGAPSFDHDNAAALATLGVPAFACTPDAFPDLMAAAIERRDLPAWVERNIRRQAR